LLPFWDLDSGLLGMVSVCCRFGVTVGSIIFFRVTVLDVQCQCLVVCCTGDVFVLVVLLSVTAVFCVEAGSGTVDFCISLVSFVVDLVGFIVVAAVVTVAAGFIVVGMAVDSFSVKLVAAGCETGIPHSLLKKDFTYLSVVA